MSSVYIDLPLPSGGTPGADGIGAKTAIIGDAKSSGTNGGTSASTTWNERTLNTIFSDPYSIVTSLSGNAFTLPAGSYKIMAKAPAASCLKHRLRLIDSGATVLAYGQTGWTSGSDVTYVNAELLVYLTLASSTAIKLQHYTQTGTANIGLGFPGSLGVDELYAFVEITLIG